MSYQSLSYFLDNFGGFDKQLIKGYFDFSDLKNTGVDIFTGNDFNKENFLALNINNNSFWDTSGFGNFSGKNFYEISGNLLQDFFYFFVFSGVNSGKNNVLFSSYEANLNNQFSGFEFGINTYSYPYLKYYDNNFKEIYFSYSKKIGADGVGIFYLYPELYGNIKIGKYDIELGGFLEEKSTWISDFELSNRMYIGGNLNIDINNNFSGFIKELIIANPTRFYDPSVFVSGFAHKVLENTITGSISGETGILYGDVIEVTKCFVEFSGSEDIVFEGLYTGIDYYTPTYQEFIDFNNETFSNYLYSGVSGTGFLSGFIPVNSIISCTNTETGYDIYEYDSGYKIDYSIKNISIILDKIQYLYDINEGIKLNFNLHSGDIICAYFQPINEHINFGSNFLLKNYSLVSNTYFFDQDIDISGIYYNGIFQKNSTGFSSFYKDQVKICIPDDGDYFIDNKNIFSNNFYISPEQGYEVYNPISTDLWSKSGKYYMLNTGWASGNSLIEETFEKSMVFLNGQLLTSGLDYSLPSKILLNIQSGYNLLTVKNIDNDYFLNIKNINENNIDTIYFDSKYVSNNLIIWHNGVRLINNQDYMEI